MIESILNTIKQLLGIPATDTAFDTDIIVQINSAFMALHQLGVGPTDVFSIDDNTAVWTDFTADVNTFSMCKTYIMLFVKELFDPPASAAHMTSIQNMRREIEWRLSVQIPVTE